MRTPPFYNPPTPDFSAINRSLEWTINPTLPALLEHTYQAVIERHNESKPLMVVAYDVLSNIVDYYRRATIAFELKKKVLDYLEKHYTEKEELKKQAMEFDSLVHFLEMIDLVCSDVEEIKQFYKGKPDVPVQKKDSFVYFWALGRRKYRDEFLCFSQLHYYYGHKADEQIAPELFPLYAYTFRNNIIASPAVNFCISLLEGQTYINKFLNKNPQTSLVSVKDFNVNLRNFCFDEYIDIKGEEERRFLLNDNARDEEPTHYDGEVELLKKEVQSYTAAEEQHMDGDILKMTEFFINRLRKSLGFETPKDEIDPSSKEFNIHNHDEEIDKRIKAVFKSKIYKNYADWGVIMRLLVELGEYTASNYTAVAKRINTACGKQVTTASALKTSHAMTDVGGTWNEGWIDKVRNRQSANLLNRFKEIARVFLK